MCVCMCACVYACVPVCVCVSLRGHLAKGGDELSLYDVAAKLARHLADEPGAYGVVCVRLRVCVCVCVCVCVYVFGG